MLDGTKTIRPFALKGHGSVAHSASPHGLLTRSPFGLWVLIIIIVIVIITIIIIVVVVVLVIVIVIVIVIVNVNVNVIVIVVIVIVIVIVIIIIIIIIIINIIVSITKFSIVIGSQGAYLSLNRRVITWVSNYRCPI